MANNYCLTSTEYMLTKDQVKRAEEIIEEVGKLTAAEYEDIDLESEEFSNLESQIEFIYKFEDDCIWIYNEENANPEQIAEVISRFQVEFKADEPFFFEYCCYCDKPRVDEFAGGCFCIMPDGSISHSGNRDDALEKATNPFTTEERNTLFEAARIALGDAVTFSDIVDATDIDDKEMSKLVEKLQKFMDKS